MSKTFRLQRSRNNTQFDNPLVLTGLGFGRRNDFTNKKLEERRKERRNKLRREHAWDF